MWNLDDVPIYVAIVECGGISAAAERLEMSKSAVSKALGRLEESLGVRLSERNSRNFRITEAGELFYRHCLQVVQEADRAATAMSDFTSTPMGRLVVSLPMAFAREIVAPHLPRFMAEFPRIDLEVVISSHTPDIIRDNIDVAVVVGTPADSELVIRKLYRSRLVLVASPAYLEKHQPGNNLEELASHIRMCEKRYSGKIPALLDGESTFLQIPNTAMRINEPTVVRDSIIRGCGIGMVPDQYCRRALASGELVRVLPQLEMNPDIATVSAIYPNKHLASTKTRVFLQFITDICKEI
ncbi:LysR family transcriptional regulator [Parathalassolituus penaei]|uniref:LysR family transcriptional regulator n=1 Tax=Parathalassolituus penaei TaxID=2997323 RepID=A0A9X3EFJ6_9GAMM|nr:LysR family transcriptional regulator [Parathalassolituus penaei]MCY0966341.1 LysR family transcriptional regulator [Parathalassolituus penaei]